MDGTQVVGKSLRQQTVAKVLSDIQFRTENHSSTAVLSLANSPRCRRNSPQAVGVVAVQRGALRVGTMANGTCLMSSAASGWRIYRSSIASDCLLSPQSRPHPCDPRIALVPPRKIDIAARLLRVRISQTVTHARTYSCSYCFCFVLQSNREKS